MPQTKKELRQLVRQWKRTHENELPALSDRLCQRVQADGLWRSAGTVLLYYPLPDEVDVRPLVRHALLLGKRVLLPVVVGDDLVLREYREGAVMQVDVFGISEPTGPDFTDYESVDFALVPGMAFDVHGRRVGRGKGYYDRLLPRLPRAYIMGICFPFQYFPSVPSEPHDILMDEVVAG
ncbi:MAG: 5-formyltetrahydrofolate cyclo-ligase [Bacteroidaceae bacterium]|nr:5-formyltetrahydrofolate cyclo-ligase [Bacteroidaceae bacterium]